MLPYPATVAQAAKDLDTIKPDWYNLVNLDSLEMMSPFNCIIAQSLGDWMCFHDNWDTNIPFGSVGPFTKQITVPLWAIEIGKRKVAETIRYRLSLKAMKQKRDKQGRFVAGNKVKKVFKAIKKALS